MPASRFKVVDLPQPEGPRMATNSPSAISRSRGSIAATSPQRLATPLSSIRAICLTLDSADVHLRQVALGEGVEHDTREYVEDADGGHHGVVDAHHVVLHPGE